MAVLREFVQMASATLCFTGFSREEITPILTQFEQANAALGNRWSLVPEAEARVLVIDMDSMYGHMTWLKAQGSGKTTIGVTTGDRSETDYLLKRPFATNSLETLLGQLVGNTGGRASGPAPTAASPSPSRTTIQAPPSATARPPVPAAPDVAAAAVDDVDAPIGTRSDPSADYIAAVTTGQMAAMAPTVPHEPRISDYLPAGRLGGPARLKQMEGAPLIAFDPSSQTYAGSATLKPLLPYVNAVIDESELIAIDATEFESIKAGTGGAQPYMRLLWLCGLTVGNGHLLPGFSPSKKFQLTKWPQIEREYPKHFRLATVMMKGPALVREIAELSGVPELEVIDFVNAGLLTGAVVIDGTSTSVGDVSKASALLAKPRAG